MKEAHKLTSGSMMEAATASRMLSEAFGVELTEAELRNYDFNNIGREISRRQRLSNKRRRLRLMELEV